MKFISKSPIETEKIAKKIVSSIKEIPLIYALYGNLGSGKTVFVRGAGKLFGIKKMRSPSFVYMYIYHLSDINFYHIDLYRVEEKSQIFTLGLFDVFEDRKGIIFIEWADKAEELLPEKRVDVFFKIKGETKREIKLLSNFLKI